MALRAQVEGWAAQRRALPLGGEVPQDYVFERIGEHMRPEQVRMSELFAQNGRGKFVAITMADSGPRNRRHRRSEEQQRTYAQGK